MDWAESRQEFLDDDILGHLLNHKSASEDFLIYLDEQDPELVQKRINEWIKTREGQKWYTNTLEAMIDDRPEMEPEDMPGSDR